MNDRKNNFMCRLKTGVPLAPYTTFKIGGPARYYFEPKNLSDFKTSISWALRKNIPYFILGGGSNILVHDSGYKGLVINTKKLNKLNVKGTIISAECGVTIDRLVDLSLKYGLSGIEFAAGLPGTVGGALFMNARSYDSTFSNIVDKVFAVKAENTCVMDIVLKKDKLRFSYKQSIFQGKRFYIFKVNISLAAGSKKKIQSAIDENRKKRKEMGQYVFPNAGCIFKNDYRVGIPTGKIIEELGLKGKRIGNAEVYEEHANFIINRGNARAEDVYGLIRFIENEVKKKKGIILKREINLIGSWEELEKKQEN